MACRGCSQVGDCACAVVGDGGAITVTGTGSALDPYVVEFTGDDFGSSLPDADPDLCTTATKVVAQLEDLSMALIPAPAKCSDPGMMIPMCNTTTGVFEGWAISSVDCDGTIALEYFDEDGLTQGTTLPATWKPCVQGETGPEWTPSHATETYAAIVDVDFSQEEFLTIPVSGDLELTGSNYAAAAQIHIRLTESGSASRSLTFPAGWVFVGSAAPSTLAADATAQLTLTAYGATETDVIARWEVTP